MFLSEVSEKTKESSMIRIDLYPEDPYYHDKLFYKSGKAIAY